MSTLYVTEPPTDGKVVLHTPKGEIEIELWTREAPKACRNFVALALEGYYDACVWHRIVPGFIIQTGDPSGTGTGGESFFGAPFENELHQRLRFNRRGLVAMANTGERNTNESQFFNKYTIFGRVAGSTIYNVLSLADVEMSESVPDRPVYPPKLLRAEVVHHPFQDLVPRITPAEREAQQKAKALASQRQSTERQRKKQKKNTALLSFGEEEDVPLPGKKVPMSSHDLLNDHRLSKSSVQKSAKKPKLQPEAETVAKAEPTLSREQEAEAEQEAKAEPELEPEREPEREPEPASLSSILSLDRRPSPPRPRSSGRSMLASFVQQYKKEKKGESSTISRLDAFRQKMRTHEPSKSTPGSHAADAWGEEEEDMREYGASDDDDSDWRSHKFDSGGAPLHGSGDQYSVYDYTVVDPCDTKSSVAASLGFSGRDAVQRHEAQARAAHIRSHGRRGRDWT